MSQTICRISFSTEREDNLVGLADSQDAIFLFLSPKISKVAPGAVELVRVDNS